MLAPPRRNDGKRKLIEFRPELWQALGAARERQRQKPRGAG